MDWQVFSRPDAENDVIEIAAWYESRHQGLGDRFVDEFLQLLDDLTVNPLLHCRRHPRKNIRWRYPKSFPYRGIYEVVENERIVVVAAVLHAARHDRQWKQRV
jgi:plasmid stabilization system protein ParE